MVELSKILGELSENLGELTKILGWVGHNLGELVFVWDGFWVHPRGNIQDAALVNLNRMSDQFKLQQID